MSTRLTDKAIERTWKHLLLLERKVGQPLLREMRYRPSSCPISNFAPAKDSYDNIYSRTMPGGKIIYDAIHYKVGGGRETVWYEGLSQEDRATLNKELLRRINSRGRSGK